MDIYIYTYIYIILANRYVYIYIYDVYYTQYVYIHMYVLDTLIYYIYTYNRGNNILIFDSPQRFSIGFSVTL